MPCLSTSAGALRNYSRGSQSEEVQSEEKKSVEEEPSKEKSVEAIAQEDEVPTPAEAVARGRSNSSQRCKLRNQPQRARQFKMRLKSPQVMSPGS